MYRKTLLIAVGFLLLFSILVPIHAQAQVETLQPVRVGYFDYPGLIEKNASGEYAGYIYEYLEEIAYYTGWNYEFVYGSWEQCIQWLADGKIDLLGAAQYSDKRAQRFRFGMYEAGIEYATILVEEKNNTVFYSDYESLQGLRIGLMEDSFQNTHLEQYARAHDIHFTGVYFDSALAQNRALAEGRIDAILTSSLQQSTRKKAVAKFMPMPYYFMTNKSGGALIAALDKAMEAIQTEDVNFNTKLYSKYYGENSSNHLAFTREETAFIAAHPRLQVAYNADWNPVGFTDPDTKEFSGINADIMKVLSERSGIQFSFVPALSEADALGKVKNGTADMICGFPGRYMQEAHSYNVILTKPFFNVPVSLSTGSGLTVESVRTIAVPANATALHRYAAELFPHARILVLGRTEDCVYAVQHGTADAVFENTYVMDQYAKNGQSAAFGTVESTRAMLPISIGISDRQDIALRSLLNKLISQLDTSKVSSIVVENTMEGPGVHFSVVLQQYGPPILALFLFVIMGILIHSKKRIERFAFIDSLTGHENMAKFTLSADRLFRSRGHQSYAIVSLDIDKFKLINNMHSYETGNKILCAIADVLNREITSNELYCRDSNDQFILLLWVTGEGHLERRLPEIVNKITRLPRSVGEDFQYTISCGAYAFQEGEKNLHRAIGWAGLARERAKAHRQDWIVYYNDEMRKEAEREQEIENRMEAALENEEFLVYYQPKIRLTDSSLVGAEALVRWKPRDGALCYPDQFIPVFEGNGFIVRLDLYVFKQVCIQLREWLDRGIVPCPISVNLSRVHLNQQDFYLQYFELLRAYQIPHNLIEMELTESTIFENKTQIATLISKLKTNGLTVSIDDFGSGYSSLSVMKDLPFDYLKLDKEFFNAASDTERGKIVIQGAIFLADGLHMEVVAEGVETLEQVEFLKTIHCQIVQGYYFSKPLPVRAFEVFSGWESTAQTGV